MYGFYLLNDTDQVVSLVESLLDEEIGDHDFDNNIDVTTSQEPEEFNVIFIADNRSGKTFRITVTQEE